MAEASSFEYTPCPLQFYDFRYLDHKKNCLAYSSTLNKQDVLSVDELETLHADLSLLREHVQKRIGLLTSEMGVLNEWQVKREYKRRHDPSDSSQQSSSGRPSKPHPHNTGHDGFPPVSKRMKMGQSHVDEHGSGGGGGAKSSKKKGVGKSKAGPSEPPIEELQPVIDPSAPLLKLTDVTDKFWSTIEPYCADITEEDLRMLQDYGSTNDPSLFEIPPLGPHYARQWGVEDLEEEGARLHHDNISTRTEAEIMLQDGISQTRTAGGGPCGPLTQKLIAAFIEDSPSSDPSPQPRQPASSSSLPPLSPKCLEARLRDELVSLGLLDPNEPQKEISSNEREDEVVRELEKAQLELRQVIEFNRQQKQMLHSLARAEMRRQEVRKKLQETDSELMETLRRFASYRQRKKREPLSRKDKEIAENILETRQRLISQLLV